MLVRLLGAAVWAFVFPLSGLAALYIQDYDPLRHERFCDSDGAAFIGEGYDFSGVGRTSTSRWVTMISPTYFVSAGHYFPQPGTTVTFYEGNEKSEEFAHRYVVDDFTMTMYWNGETSDLKVGKLVVPEGQSEAILPQDGITSYPVVSPDDFAYFGAELFVYGRTDRVGTNNVSKICPLDNCNSANRCITEIMEFLFTPDVENGQGADEAYVMSGDSGGPSFVVIDGELALAGIHYYNYGSTPIPGYASGDSFVPAYLDQLTGFEIAGDVTGDQQVDCDDLDALRTFWGICSTGGNLESDLSGDGRVGLADLDLVREYWNQTGPAAWIKSTSDSDDIGAVPEPSLWSLIAILALILPGYRFRFLSR